MPLWNRDRRWYLGLTITALVVAVFPYVWMWWQARSHGWIFSGLIYAPYDGYTYLAKMREGWMGAWRFTLPYTAHPGDGAYLYLFHLALGHLARITHLSLPLTYHLARLAGVIMVVWALGRYFAAMFPDDDFARRFAWVVSLFGLGMGWMILPWTKNMLPMDFWVTEVYPFLTILTNAHFPWALALMLVLLTPGKTAWWHVLASAGLALLSPFGVVLTGLILAFWFVWVFTADVLPQEIPWWDVRRFPAEAREILLRGLAVLVGGAPYTAYTYWVTHHDPILAQWTAQNDTPLPPWWNMLFALLPWVALALGAWRRAHPARRPLAVWAAAAFVLAFLPTALQRRFLMGVYVPLVGLAVLAWRQWLESRWGKLAWALVLPSVLAILLLPAGAGKGSSQPQQPSPSLLFLTRGEAEAMTWLRENTPADAVVLAAPDTGAMIPAWSGRRVLYGHPMETPEAPRYRELTGDFFRRCFKGTQAAAFLRREDVDYIFVGPREQALGGLPLYLPPEAVVARFPGVTIYRVPNNADS